MIRGFILYLFIIKKLVVLSFWTPSHSHYLIVYDYSHLKFNYSHCVIAFLAISLSFFFLVKRKLHKQLNSTDNIRT